MEDALLLRSFDPVGPGDTVQGRYFALLPRFARGFPALAQVMLYLRMPGQASPAPEHHELTQDYIDRGAGDLSLTD
jgi:hypothetical protein